MIDYYIISGIVRRKYNKRIIRKILCKYELCHKSKYLIAWCRDHISYDMLLAYHTVDVETRRIIYVFGNSIHRQIIFRELYKKG